MIHVIATVHVKPEFKAQFLGIFQANVPAVLAEAGCIEYTPTIDVDLGLSAQSLDENVITIIEKWETVAALQAHMGAPHMLAYRDKTANMVEKVSLKILQTA